jgi:hypothetical protein
VVDDDDDAITFVYPNMEEKESGEITTTTTIKL